MNFNTAEFYRSFGEYSQLPPSDRMEIAFSGRSNVGKSSLINKVLGRRNIARVSSMPGKTATINFFTLENIYLADLPGYGYAKVAKSEKQRWAGLIDGYLKSGRDIGVIFQLIDYRHPPTRDDLMMIDFMIESELPFVIVFTKADKLTKREREERMTAFGEEIPFFKDITHVDFSAETGEGAEEIRRIIEELAEEGS